MTKKKPHPPHGLSPEARKFWKGIRETYALDDVAGRMLLLRACEALDRLRRAQAIVKVDGEIIVDARGSKKRHPAVMVEAEAHRQLIESLRALKLATPEVMEQI